MRKWLSSEHYKKIYRFFGPQVLKYFVLGAFAGISLFAVELAFAYGLQAFLQVIGVMQAATMNLPSWVPQSETLPVLAFVVIIGTIRGSLQAGQVYMCQAADETLKRHQRSRLVKWAFFSETASSSQVMTLFNERVKSAGLSVLNIQRLSVTFTAAVLLWCTLFYLSPIMTIAATGALFVFGILNFAYDRSIGKMGNVVKESGNTINHRVLLNIKNLLLMQIYGTQKREEALVQKDLDTYCSNSMGFFWLAAMKYGIPQIIGVLVICIITLIAQRHANLEASLLLTYFYLFIRFVQNSAETSRTGASLKFHWPQLVNLAQWWAEHSFDGIRRPKKNIYEDTAKNISNPVGWNFSKVEFKYPGADLPVLKDLDLKIEPGKTIVVTGPSGAGKSTLLYLLLGNLKPSGGSLTVVHPDNKQEQLEKIRAGMLKSIGYVGAESFIIEGSVMDNLTYGLDTTPDKDSLQKALKQSDCQFVDQLPNGLEHHLTEQGQGLSAGQKQRLSLARALLRKPKILILDEATANLDLDTEERLVETLSQLKGEMTIVAATHRQALLKIADQHLKL